MFLQDAKESKAKIAEIVQNVQCIETLTNDEYLISKYQLIVAGAFKSEEYTFLQKILMMQIVYR